MKSNVGGLDKVLRIVVGLAVLSLFFFLEGAAKWWGLVGLIPLGTGLMGILPAVFDPGLEHLSGRKPPSRLRRRSLPNAPAAGRSPGHRFVETVRTARPIDDPSCRPCYLDILGRR